MLHIKFELYKKNVWRRLAHSGGFTMIDLIVSASIVAILSAMVIANYRGADQKIILDNEAERLSSIIRQANIDALIGQTVNGVRPPGGFGIHIEKCTQSGALQACSYSLFADQDQNYHLSAADDVIQEIKTFDANVEFTAIDSSSEGEVQSLDIIFVPPQGKMYFYDNDAAVDDLLTDETIEITLHFYKTDYQKKIVLNRISNQIDIR
jgi:type II secretory pathway pseudopilin PulG